MSRDDLEVNRIDSSSGGFFETFSYEKGSSREDGLDLDQPAQPQTRQGLPMERLPGSPYKFIEPLGEGGMGEVFLAFDSRLKRQVAIKRLKESRLESNASRQRFQRESQLIASLNHQAIVQIYDVVSWEQAHWLVMEYVDGCTLRQLLSDSNSLSLAKSLHLALHLVAGLDHAHTKGIIHRDLKAENILIDAKGQPKIVDFGLAKNLSTNNDQQNLTEAGAMIGTIYAMSPEQAMGHPAGFRSDLFSLGVLLYESVTGVSPFKGQNRHNTLHRILYHHPEPVHRLSPSIPRSFSDLIMHLLEKDSEQRPRHAHALFETIKSIQAGTCHNSTCSTTLSPGAPAPEPRNKRSYRHWLALPVLMVIALTWVFIHRTEKEEPELQIGILKSETGDPEIRRLLAGVDLALRNSLSGLKGLSLINESELKGRKGEPAKIALAIAADELITYQIECSENQCELILARLAAENGKQIWGTRLPFLKHNERLLARAFAPQLEATYARVRVFPDQSIIPDHGDYGVYLGLDSAFRDGSLPKSDIAKRLAKLRHRSPGFFEVYLLETQVAKALFLVTREPNHLDHGLALTELAKKLQPHNPRSYQLAFSLALSAGRVKRAEKELEQILQFGSERSGTLKMRAQFAEHQKEQDEALLLNRLLTELVPSAANYCNLADLERKLGLIPDARKHYSASLEKDPFYHRAQRNLAGLELINGDVVYAKFILCKLVKDGGNTTQNLSNLGLAYLLLGRYDKAVTNAALAYAKSPKQIPLLLNYADALGLDGRNAEAASKYTLILKLIEVEPNQKRYLPAKAQALAQLGQHLEAAQTIQEALSQRPDHTNTIYAAAIVYSLIGDRTSALINTVRAAERGRDARWFSFPWFDELHGLPQFQTAMLFKPSRVQ